jgi:hypothetical protein
MSARNIEVTYTQNQARGIIAAEVHRQLPRQLQEKFSVIVQGDPFNLRALAVFTPIDGQSKPVQTELNTTVENGVVKFARIPDDFLALLCVAE